MQDINQLVSRIDDLSLWLDYINIAHELREYELSLFLEKIIEAPPDVNPIIINGKIFFQEA